MCNQRVDSELHVSFTTDFSFQKDCSMLIFFHGVQAEDIKIWQLQSLIQS